MNTITIPVSNINGRFGCIQKIIRPLRKNNTDVGCDIKGCAQRCQVVAAYDGILSRREKWLFKTNMPGIFGEYYEYWRPDKVGKNLFLNRAYFHLYKIENRSEGTTKQIICLHCDPEESEETNKYKVGPHLHIIVAEQPIPKCHFPLNQCHLKDVLQDASSFTSAFDMAIKMIADELLSRLDN
jgi:hypothetical protein